MKNYQKWNNIIGWVVFLIAAAVYILTIEPTASFWDCGEYIATSYKLQVGHPPGAPLFQMLGRIFSLLAFGDVTKVAMWVNVMSALSSGFTILFLFWSITMIAKKLVLSTGPMDNVKMFAVFGSAFVGSLAYTFTDTFWFSAVEGEVYAMSSFLTALVFWMMLKWEVEADDKYSLRWIILIAYIIGLSIGVHLLNLLTIPSLVFIYYFKKYSFSVAGFLKTGILSIVLLVLVQNGIIPWTVKLAWLFEKFSVNTLGMPFNSGTMLYFILLTGGIVYGLYYTHKKSKVIANTVILCFTFIVIGYSSFFMLIIRSNANPPINENSPTDAVGLQAYLAREQYGDWPILYGPYFNAPRTGQSDGNPVYKKDASQKKYVIVDERKGIIPEYDERFMTFFPRMHGTRADHVSAYKTWADIKGIPIVVSQGGKRETLYRPTFGENLLFFFKYQIGHMYLRYFMWNFAGRQNDIQGHGSPVEGNWMSGISAFDSGRLGPQKDIPDDLANNKGRNTYYFLPLILGLLGFFFHVKKDYKDTIVISLLFIMTGIATIIYLNQTPYQPRERDYAYAASFYAFAFWIAFGVLALIEYLRKVMDGRIAVALSTILTLILVPGILAKENWDDHDRSNRYTARDVARNYLESCAPNAILFTNGDNDTFPLWYLQEVEGVRTDVKVCNLSLLNTDWYIDNMMRHKTYDADPIPVSMTPDKYIQGTRDAVFIIPDSRAEGFYEVKDLIEYTSSGKHRYPTPNGPIDFLPTDKFKITVDKEAVLRNHVVALKDTSLIEPVIEWTYPSSVVLKNSLIVLDILATNNWKRPVYFAITTGRESYIGLEEYFQLEGLAYRFLPIKIKNPDGQIGRIDTDIMYNNMMNKFMWGNMNDSSIYLNEDNIRLAMNFRNNFARLATALLNENKTDSALAALDKCFEVMPEKAVPYNFYVYPLAECYYRAGAIEKGNAISQRLIEISEKELKFYFAFNKKFEGAVDREKQFALGILQRINQICNRYNQTEIAKKAEEIFTNYYKLYAES